jgi:hypothetical protein
VTISATAAETGKTSYSEFLRDGKVIALRREHRFEPLKAETADRDGIEHADRRILADRPTCGK